MSFSSPTIGGGYKVGDQVLIQGQPYYWVITGVKLNMKRGKLVELSRHAQWTGFQKPITISTSVPVSKLEKTTIPDRNRQERRRVGL